VRVGPYPQVARVSIGRRRKRLWGRPGGGRAPPRQLRLYGPHVGASMRSDVGDWGGPLCIRLEELSGRRIGFPSRTAPGSRRRRRGIRGRRGLGSIPPGKARPIGWGPQPRPHRSGRPAISQGVCLPGRGRFLSTSPGLLDRPLCRLGASRSSRTATVQPAAVLPRLAIRGYVRPPRSPCREPSLRLP